MTFSQISVQAADVKTVVRVFSIEVAAHELNDINETTIVTRLRTVSPQSALFSITFSHTFYSVTDGLSMPQAGGASYDGV